MTRFAVRRVTGVAVVAGVLLAWSASPVVAGGVVGNGTRTSCTEGALDAALAGGGSVTFDCGARPFRITVTVPKTITADTSIDGGGLLAISGGGKTQMFEVDQGATLDLSNVIVRRGRVDQFAPPQQGGAIANFGTLTVTNCTFSRNRGFLGGAIKNGGTLTVRNSTFFANRSSGQGGAIDNGGTLTISHSTFVRNTVAAEDSAVLTGGAINSLGGDVTVTDTTFSQNRANGFGGAMYFFDGTLRVTNSTFSGNFANRGQGGAIVNSGATFSIANCTFYRNRATGNMNDDAFNGRGGAMANYATLSVTNSTFSRNVATSGGAIWGEGTFSNSIIANISRGGNCGGSPITDGGHSLRWPQRDTSCVGTFADPNLAGLANNGGPTKTLRLKSGSAAINAGDNAICAAAPVNNLDQRGSPRPGPGSTNCSIGAYEF